MFKKLLVAAAVLLLFSFSANASEFNFTGNGARAAGMGYAFTGVADDATAISWNSAGLTQLYSMEASVIGRLGFGTYTYTDLDNAPDITESSKFQLNFLSIVMPFNVANYKVVGGIAFRNIYDFNSELTFDFEGTEYIFANEGGINAITPSVAVQINEMFSVGAALNIYTGSEDYYEEIDGEKTYESATTDYSGTSIDIGILVKPSSKFSIGANLNLPNTITSDTDGYEYDIDVPFFYSIGLGYRATDNLLLALDFHSRNWSNSDLFADSEVDVDLNSLHFGIEYLAQSGSSVIPLRLGFHTNPLFEWDKNGDQVVNPVITLGAGIIMNKFILDAAFEYEPASYEFEDSFDTYTVEQNSFRFTLGGTIHFGK
ncbi:MAG: OmpP1/FadL family transporter [Calditrichaceae bacterium]